MALRRAQVWSALLLVAAGCKSGSGGEARVWDTSDGGRLEVRFEGLGAIGEGELREVIAPDLETAARRSSLRATVDDAAYSAEVHYRREGFPACVVEYAIEEGEDDTSTAVLLVEEGPRVRIGEVRFVRALGPELPLSIDPEELESFVVVKRRLFLPEGERWYVAERLEDARAAVEAYYRSRGWLAAQVSLLEPQPDREDWDETVPVVMEVREGPLHHLRAVEVEGGLDAIDRELAQAARAGTIVHPRLGASLRSRLREAYARRGYPDAEVRVEESRDSDSGDVALTFAVEPGPHVVLGEVRIEGNELTRESRIRRNVVLESGEPYDVRDQRKTFENLYQLGVFSTVSVELADEPSGETEDGSQVRDVDVRVGPAPTREFYFEPGYGSYERLRAIVGWRERNLLGTARILDIEARVSQRSYGGKIGVSDPRFLDSDTAAALTFFAGEREEPSYTKGEVGSLLSFSRQLSERISASLGYQYRFTEVTADDFNDPAVQPFLENANISSIVLTPTWDARDHAFYPESGQYVRTSLEYSSQVIGSTLDFVRLRWQLSHFAELDEFGVLGLSWRGGAIGPFAETDAIPIQERFFNGGENTVRAFREDQLGPKDNEGNPIGGEGFNVFTAELRVPVSGRLESAVFYDIGNVVEDVADIVSDQGYRGGLGVGLRYALPVGPLRLDSAWSDDPEAGEPTWVVHFSVGFSF